MVQREREGGKRFLKYYMADFGSILGSGTRFPTLPQSGHEYVLTLRPSLLTLLTFGAWVRPWLRDNHVSDLPAVGRFSAEHFDPASWVAEYPKAAYDNMRADDAFWAARIVARFSDDAIRAIVGKGRYSDVRTVDTLTTALIKRRDRIKEVWLTGVNPIANPTLSPNGQLAFENTAVMYGLAGARPEGYTLRWSRFDNATDTHTAVGSEAVVSEPQAAAPAVALANAEYVAVTIETRHPRFPMWKPVQVYFRRAGDGWQTVGIDRGLDSE
jgi:hypothetical protein